MLFIKFSLSSSYSIASKRATYRCAGSASAQLRRISNLLFRPPRLFIERSAAIGAALLSNHRRIYGAQRRRRVAARLRSTRVTSDCLYLVALRISAFYHLFFLLSSFYFFSVSSLSLSASSSLPSSLLLRIGSDFFMVCCCGYSLPFCVLHLIFLYLYLCLSLLTLP